MKKMMKKKMKNKNNIYSIHLDDSLIYLKNQELKIYKDYINFKSLYSSKIIRFEKKDILLIQIYRNKKEA